MLAEAERSGATAEQGAGTAADWVAVETRQTRRAARSDLKLAQRLETYAVLGRALESGEVNTAQARVIVTALDRLPDKGEFAVSVEQKQQAEQHLVEQAAHFDADRLKILGMHLFEVIAPDLSEKLDGRVLEAQEAKALRKVSFSMWEDAEGICHGQFRVPHLHGQILTKALQAFTNPARPEESAIDADLPSEVRNGLAFTSLLEAIPATWLPRHGGVGATVVVTMTLEQLMADLDAAGVCTLDTGGRISAAEARRLACGAGIIPMVLGGKSQPLDVGRKRRFHTEAMRLAMGVRDGGCSAEGCDKPASMCHSHHDIAWSADGPTSVASGRLLCGHHHRSFHRRT